MKNQKNKNLVSWDDHLDQKYGKIGTPSRDKYEQEFEAFKLGVLIQEARKKRSLTQEELALKVGTTKIISPELRIMPVTSDFRP